MINLEVVLNVFTIDEGDIKILLIKKTEDPYKGYWMLPTKSIDSLEPIEQTKKKFATEEMGLPEIPYYSVSNFNTLEKTEGVNTITMSYAGFIDNTTLSIKEEKIEDLEKMWFPISNIPKLCFNHAEIIDSSIEYFKERILYTDVLKTLFPSDFSLPELQKVVEFVTNKKVDRRNFRKRLLNFDLIEDTGFIQEGNTGRPPKLYRFREGIDNYKVF